MFQDPITALMAMLFLCFGGILLMFVFVIRSLAAQAESRKEDVRRQQLMLADIERQLMDMKGALRRHASAAEKEEQKEEHFEPGEAYSSSDALLPILQGEDPLVSMLETASRLKDPGADTPRESGGKLAPPVREQRNPWPEGMVSAAKKRPVAQSPLQSSLIRSQQLLGGQASRLPDAFGEGRSAGQPRRSTSVETPVERDDVRDEATSSGEPPAQSRDCDASASAAPENASVESKGVLHFDDTDSMDSMDIMRERTQPPVEEPSPAANRSSRPVSGVGYEEDLSLKVFSIGKNKKLQDALDDMPVLRLGGEKATSRNAEDSAGEGALSDRSARREERAIGREEEHREGESLQQGKPRLRVPGPPDEYLVDFPATDESRTSLKGHIRAGAVLPEQEVAGPEREEPGEKETDLAGQTPPYMRTSSDEPEMAVEHAPATKRELSGDPRENGATAKERINLFDMEADKEEARHMEAIGHAVAEPGNHPDGARDESHVETVAEPHDEADAGPDGDFSLEQDASRQDAPREGFSPPEKEVPPALEGFIMVRRSSGKVYSVSSTEVSWPHPENDDKETVSPDQETGSAFGGKQEEIPERGEHRKDDRSANTADGHPREVESVDRSAFAGQDRPDVSVAKEDAAYASGDAGDEDAAVEAAESVLSGENGSNGSTEAHIPEESVETNSSGDFSKTHASAENLDVPDSEIGLLEEIEKLEEFSDLDEAGKAEETAIPGSIEEIEELQGNADDADDLSEADSKAHAPEPGERTPGDDEKGEEAIHAYASRFLSEREQQALQRNIRHPMDKKLAGHRKNPGKQPPSRFSR